MVVDAGAVVEVVDPDPARSGPTTTTTSTPVVPLTGTDVVKGRTTVLFNPSDEAIVAAEACRPEA